ncbi:MAG: hypothetical protein K0Q72_3242 [Armatimonadetes bacterium]|nr:hypothetical protein [Armatimonadota bacterium]
MKLRTCGLAILLAMGVAVTACTPGMAAGNKSKKANAAAGKVSKLDATAKTFVVTSKKKGDTIVAFDDKTVFKKLGADPAAASEDATVADVKDGARVEVLGALEGGKVLATRVTVSGKRKKKNKAQ